jgi:hypothetical protein
VFGEHVFGSAIAVPEAVFRLSVFREMLDDD